MSQLQTLIASVCLVPEAWAEAAPEDAVMETVHQGGDGATQSWKQRKRECGSHVVATARMQDCWGLILALHLEEAVWDFSDSALWDFSDPHQRKVVFPPIPPQPLGFSFPPHSPEMVPGATKAPPAPRVGGHSGRQVDTQPLPRSLPSARGWEHVPRTEQWEFGVFICNPVLTPGLGGE